MNIGDYVRTEMNKIGIQLISKIKEIRDGDLIFTTNGYWDKENIIKSSPNIIDLLKKKDIVIDYKGNIYQVVKVWKDYIFTDKKNKYGQVVTLVDYQIKSIVTKEQFSSMEYKVGE